MPTRRPRRRRLFRWLFRRLEPRRCSASRSSRCGWSGPGGGDRVVTQVLVDDAGPDVGYLGPLGELVDDEGVELLVQRDRGLEIVYEDPGHHTGDVGHA